MTRTARPWATAGLPPGAYEALADGLPASRVWSLLLEIAEARAAGRRAADLVKQWERDRFVQPGVVDQRSLLEVDRLLLAAAAFESIELSPVAPLGVCSSMGHTSQNKVVSTVRGTEVVSDPTNVMALECAGRLRRDRATVVRRATSHRCVRAQEVPKGRGFMASFRLFCLATAGLEQQNHGFVVEAVGEHISTMLHGLDQLEEHGFAFPDRRITVLATEECAGLGDRIVARIGQAASTRAILEHPYYKGLRFQIAVRSSDGTEIPLADGGAFDWVAKLTSNQKAVYVASGVGSQLVPVMFRAP